MSQQVSTFEERAYTLASVIENKLGSLVEAFSRILYEDDEVFMENMKTRNLGGDDIDKYRYWEWPQGVGLFGIWRLFEDTGETCYLDILTRYYDRQLSIGLPTYNVNTLAPFLALSFLGAHLDEERYLKPCREAAAWIVDNFPRTKDQGFQHITSDTLNDQELWDDTLFMTVLFLANMGKIMKVDRYINEATYQFLIHIKYLQDRKTGLFYHGWTFDGNHNFAEALWGRGNCWITMAIPEFLSMIQADEAVYNYLKSSLERQVDALLKFQRPNGMWCTLVDDMTSYEESSATCGFAYGILRGIDVGLLSPETAEAAKKALEPIIEWIDTTGVLGQVSYGTAMGRESKDFYKNIPLTPMAYGQALAILFLHEAVK